MRSVKGTAVSLSRRKVKMSQHYIDKGSLEFMMGWDRPLQYYFLTIFNMDPELPENDENMVFSNLSLENPGMTVTQIKRKCAEFNLILPRELIRNLESDKRNNVGNKIYRYDND